MRYLLSMVKRLVHAKYSIRTKIFLSFIIVTISITSLASYNWYRTALITMQNTVMDNMNQNLDNSCTQLNNIIDDVQRLHATLVNDTNSLSYILRNDYNRPDVKWFSNYNQALSSLKIVNANLSRTISGIGIYKINGETCMSGIMSLSGNMMESWFVDEIEKANGNDVVFYTPKESQTDLQSISDYVFVGRMIFVHGKSQAVVITKINEDILISSLVPSLHQDGFTLLIDQNNKIVYDSSPHEFAAMKEDSLTMLSTELDNKEEQELNGFYIFTSESEFAGTKIVSAIPKTFVSSMYSTIKVQFISILILTILMAALISILISSKLTRGLSFLIKNMKTVGSGSMTGIMKLDTKDEIGLLSETFVDMVDQIKKLMENIRISEKQKREMEIKVLRAQISPHFLYNSLNTISYLASFQNATNIQSLTVSLIDLLQWAVKVDDKLVTVSEEISHVENYINIQQYHYPNRIHIDYQIGHEDADYLVPKMILQPIVENSLFHGFGRVKSDSTIRVKVHHDDKNLFFVVTDNGAGMSQEKIDQVLHNSCSPSKMQLNGIGINNVNDRIKMQLGNDYGINIYSQIGVFTTVEIKLPIILDDLEEKYLRHNTIAKDDNE